MSFPRHWAFQLGRRLRAAFWRAVGYRERHGWGALAVQVMCAWRWLPRLLLSPRRSCASTWATGHPARLPWGVNVIGYADDTQSLSEVALLSTEALAAAGVPVVLAGRGADGRPHAELPVSPANPYRFNLVVTGIDPVEDAGWELGRDYAVGRHNIALSPWEHDDVPGHLHRNLLGNVELWTPSSFARDAFARCTPVPVVRVPHPVRPRLRPANGRSPLLADLKEGKFVFLFVFNYLPVSYGRKNPEGAIAAFRKAFAPGDDAALVIKTNYTSDRRQLAQLHEMAADHQGIRILNASLSRDELDGLMASCDCYLSLHRSEGFGLTIAEAMAAGRPVIATRYSGNLDFTTEANSYLVDYELLRVPARFGPRRRGLLWAEPDIAHGARLMRHVYEHRDEARRKGEIGRADVARLLSPRTIGELMKERLLAIDGDTALGAGSPAAPELRVADRRRPALETVR